MCAATAPIPGSPCPRSRSCGRHRAKGALKADERAEATTTATNAKLSISNTKETKSDDMQIGWKGRHGTSIKEWMERRGKRKIGPKENDGPRRESGIGRQTEKGKERERESERERKRQSESKSESESESERKRDRDRDR
eukprot:1506467-Pleurochrysis_carterae.AAC.1